MIFHQPRFPWNRGISPSLTTFWGPGRTSTRRLKSSKNLACHFSTSSNKPTWGHKCWWKYRAGHISKCATQNDSFNDQWINGNVQDFLGKPWKFFSNLFWTTPWKINMEPKVMRFGSLEVDFPFELGDFYVPAVNLAGVHFFSNIYLFILSNFQNHQPLQASNFLSWLPSPRNSWGWLRILEVRISPENLCFP